MRVSSWWSRGGSAPPHLRTLAPTARWRRTLLVCTALLPGPAASRCTDCPARGLRPGHRRLQTGEAEAAGGRLLRCARRTLHAREGGEHRPQQQPRSPQPARCPQQTLSAPLRVSHGRWVGWHPRHRLRESERGADGRPAMRQQVGTVPPRGLIASSRGPGPGWTAPT